MITQECLRTAHVWPCRVCRNLSANERGGARTFCSLAWAFEPAHCAAPTRGHTCSLRLETDLIRMAVTVSSDGLAIFLIPHINPESRDRTAWANLFCKSTKTHIIVCARAGGLTRFFSHRPRSNSDCRRSIKYLWQPPFAPAGRPVKPCCCGARPVRKVVIAVAVVDGKTDVMLARRCWRSALPAPVVAR